MLGSDGTVYASGWNVDGELGDGTATSQHTPVQVRLPVKATAIAAGSQQGLALGSDGKVYDWGLNNHGQLGDGTTTDRDTSVAVNLSVSATAVFAGFDEQRGLALGSDGKVYCWGGCSGCWCQPEAGPKVFTLTIPVDLNLHGFSFGTDHTLALGRAAASTPPTITPTLTPSGTELGNLLLNGSFEQGRSPGGSLVTLQPGSTLITGWTVTCASIDYIGGFWRASNGRRSLDLDGTPGFGGIEQALPPCRAVATRSPSTSRTIPRVNHSSRPWECKPSGSGRVSPSIVPASATQSTHVLLRALRPTRRTLLIGNSFNTRTGEHHQ